MLHRFLLLAGHSDNGGSDHDRVLDDMMRKVDDGLAPSAQHQLLVEDNAEVLRYSSPYIRLFPCVPSLDQVARKLETIAKGSDGLSCALTVPQALVRGLSR